MSTRTYEQVNAVMRAANVLLRVAAQSVAEVEDIVTLPQLRVLVLIYLNGPQNLSAVATELNVHASNATRTCDRLVQAGLIQRGEDEQDRRFSRVDLSASGADLVRQVLDHRSTAVAGVLGKLPEPVRASVADAMDAFVDAAGDLGTDGGPFVLPVPR